MNATGLLSIDAGVNPACAYFSRTMLISAKFAKRPTGAGLATVVIEAPEYRGAVDSPRVKNLFRMAAGGYLAAGHALAGAGAGATLVELTPTQWKGTEPKPVMHARLWTILTPGERAVLGGDATYAAIVAAVDKGALARWRGESVAFYPGAFTTHNLLDAAALGCVFLGRLLKRGT